MGRWNETTRVSEGTSTDLAHRQLQGEAGQEKARVLSLRSLPEPLKRSASQFSIVARQPEGARQLALIVLLTLILIVSATTLLPILLSAPTVALPTTVQALPGAAQSVGQLSFGSSGQLDPTSSHGLNDQVTLQLHDLVPPAPGQRYYAWLLPDRGERNVAPILLGALSITAAGTARLSYASPVHADLLASMSRLLITEQPDHPQPALPSSDPATWRYGGSIPDTPTPGDENHFSLLDHLRHLLAKEPMLERLGLGGGLGIWLYRNGGKVWEWASAARDDWAGGQTTDLIHRQVIRILDYLDGASEVGNDIPAGTPWLVDPRLGSIGLLEITPEQDPPAYLIHLDVHLQGFMFAPGHTEAQKQLALKIDAALKTVMEDMQQIHQDALQLVRMDATHLAQPQALALLDDLATHASSAYVGHFDAHLGAQVGGIVWIEAELQALASIPVTTTMAGLQDNAHP